MEKNTSKIKIIVFLMIHILLLSLIIMINFLADPYELFSSKFQINSQFNENPELKIKLSKNYSYKYAIAGGSSTKYAELSRFNSELADISIYNATIPKIETMILYYLEIHPETKIIYFPIDFLLLRLCNRNEAIIKYHFKNYISLKEFYKIFLAFDTTKKSIKKIICLIKNENPEPEEVRIIRRKEIDIKTKNENQKKLYYKNTIVILDNIFKKIEKYKNVKIICYTLPINVNYQYLMFKEYGNQIDDIKKYVTKRTGMLIEMQLINEFTTEPIKNNRYFTDSLHPKPILGEMIYESLFQIKPQEKNGAFYKILNKKNVDCELNKQKEELIKYIKKHKNEYRFYENQKDF